MGASKSTSRAAASPRPVATAGPSAFAARGTWVAGGAPTVPEGIATAAPTTMPPTPSARAILVAGPRRSATAR